MSATPNWDAGYAAAIRDVVDWLAEQDEYAATFLASEIERRFGSSPETPEEEWHYTEEHPHPSEVAKERLLKAARAVGEARLHSPSQGADPETPGVDEKYRGLAGKLTPEEAGEEDHPVAPCECGLAPGEPCDQCENPGPSCLGADRALREAVKNLDLSDDYTLEQAKPGELVSCTRPAEDWTTLRAALAAIEAQREESK